MTTPNPNLSATHAALIERLEAGESSRELDEEIARTIGWTERRVSRLGLNGRSPGSMRWFPPFPDNGFGPGKAAPHRFSGPRRRAQTITILRSALQSNEGGA